MEEQITQLKQFVELCKENPALLHQPQFAFYREFIESLGGKVPAATSGMKKEKTPENADEGKSSTKTFEEVQEEEADPELALPELDNSGIIEDKTGNDEYSMGDPNKQTSEEDKEKANEHRDLAATAFNEGDLDKSLEHYTKAIELNPGSAILHAKRANTLLKMSKLSAAIKDCDKAIKINPDSAAPYKFRGRAHRLMGNWLEAHNDLAISCKLDYDDVAYEWLKEVEPNSKKLQEYQRTKERLGEEKELHTRRERVRRAQEAKKTAEEEAKKHGSGGGGDFGMGPFSELFKELADDPELLNALKNDPSLVKKLTDIMQNPGNIIKHLNDPKMMQLIGKLGAKMGLGGKFAGGGAGEHGKPWAKLFEGANVINIGDQTFTFNDGKPQAKKAPEPDLD